MFSIMSTRYVGFLLFYMSWCSAWSVWPWFPQVTRYIWHTRAHNLRFRDISAAC